MLHRYSIDTVSISHRSMILSNFGSQNRRSGEVSGSQNRRSGEVLGRVWGESRDNLGAPGTEIGKNQHIQFFHHWVPPASPDPARPEKLETIDFIGTYGNLLRSPTAVK